MREYSKIFHRAQIDKDLLLPYIDLFPQRATILDAGCGPGSVLKIMRAQRDDLILYGVDNNDDLLDMAKENNPEVNFVNADIKELPYVNNFFDGCFIRMVFDILKYEDYEQIISEIVRVSKDKSIVLINGNIQSTMGGSEVPLLTTKIVNASRNFSRISNYKPFDPKRIFDSFKRHQADIIDINYIIKDNIFTPMQSLIDYYTEVDVDYSDNNLVRFDFLKADDLKLYETEVVKILNENKTYVYFIQLMMVVRINK